MWSVIHRITQDQRHHLPILAWQLLFCSQYCSSGLCLQNIVSDVFAFFFFFICCLVALPKEPWRAAGRNIILSVLFWKLWEKKLGGFLPGCRNSRLTSRGTREEGSQSRISVQFTSLESQWKCFSQFCWELNHVHMGDDWNYIYRALDTGQRLDMKRWLILFKKRQM